MHTACTTQGSSQRSSHRTARSGVPARRWRAPSPINRWPPMTNPLVARPEREQTDERLGLESARADRALDAEISEADETADAVISRARARADALLAAARTKTDETSMGGQATDALKTSR